MSDSTLTADQARAKVNDLIKDQRTAVLTTVHEGRLVARPMACQEAEFDGTLWFFAFSDSNKVQEIRDNHEVNVFYPKEGSWVSISGTATAIHDDAKARELWSDFAAAWFQCEPEDPKVLLIRVDADTAEYWDSPGKVGSLLGLAKAKITGDRPDDGENETVDL